MPFAPEFDDVYRHFIRPVLKGAGFEVTRADESKGQKSIIKDIIEGIALADLIVADLTRTNGNVCYEVGIAHKERKPVILITQSIEDVPSDLKAYRVSEYAPDFPAIEEAKERLSKLATEFLEGAEFENPISDFWPSGVGDYGNGLEFRDYLRNIREYCNQITEEISKDVQALDNHSKELSKAVANLSLTQGKSVGRICDVFAERIESLASGFRKYNADYENSISNPQGDLGFLISRYENVSKETSSEIISLKASLLVNSSRLVQLASRLESIPANLYLHGFAGQRLYLGNLCNQSGAEIRAIKENIVETIVSLNSALKKHA